MYIRKTTVASKCAMFALQRGLDEFEEQAFIMRQRFRAALSGDLFAVGRLRSFRQRIKY